MSLPLSLAELDADLFAELERQGLSELSTWAPGAQNPLPATFYGAVLSCAMQAYGASSAPLLAVMRTESYVSQTAWLAVHEPRVVGLVGNPDSPVVWSCDGVPVASSSAARLLLSLTLPSPYCRVEVGEQMVTDLGPAALEVGADPLRLLVGPLLVLARHDFPDDLVVVREAHGGGIPLFFAAGLDDLGLVTYQQLRDDGLSSPEALEAVQLLAAKGRPA